MDFNSTIEIILKDLREAREIIDDLKNYPGVPLLQIELAKTKCKSAEEVISLLKILKPGLEDAERKTEKKKSTEETLIVISDEEPAEKTDIKPAARVQAETAAEKTEPAPQVSPEEKTPAGKPQESTGRKKAGTKIFADKFNGTKQTILDTFGDKKDDGISEILKSQPVSDLTEIIGINDKFLFIREIFGGNRHAYEEAIAKLNSVNSIDEAKEILKGYYSEGEDNEIVNQLLNLVKRKLPPDE